MSNFKRNLKWYILGTLFLAAVLVWLAVLAYQPSGFLEVIFFDVGQGDAIFIEAPNGNQILIDGGPDKSVLRRLGEAMPFWDRSIDLLILTHPHFDHLAGLIEVLKRYRVGAILATPMEIQTSAFAEFSRIVAEKKIPVYYAKKGTAVKFGNSESPELLILSSAENEEKLESRTDSFGEKGKVLNESSIVGMLVFGKTKFLLTGDAGEETEQKLIAENVDLSVDVLKVGHHGSKYSTSEEFLRLVSPEYAVISVGAKNRYGHPAPQTLERLKIFGAKIFRTDLDGNILFQSGGADLLLVE